MSLGVRILVAFVLVALLAGQAAGEELRRYTIVFDAFVDGQKQDGFPGEATLIHRLADSGFELVDESQSRRIRSVTDAGILTSGGISPVLTSLDADLIVAGVSHLTAVESRLLGEYGKSYSGRLVARVIAVDTGRILGAFELRARGAGFTKHEAIEDASGRVVAELARKIVALDTRSDRFELLIAGIPSVATSQRVVDSLLSVPGIASVHVRQRGRALTKLTLDAEGTSATEIALAIDATPGIGLSVFGTTPGTINAEYSVAKAFSLNLVPAMFSSHDEKQTTGSWLRTALPSMLASSLLNVGYLKIPEGYDPRPFGSTRQTRTVEVQELGLDPNATLILDGSVRTVGSGLVVEARLEDAATGTIIHTAQEDCAVGAIGVCVAELGAALVDDLFPSLLSKRRLLPGMSQPAATAGTLAGPQSRKPLVVESFSVDGIFPTQLPRYFEGSVATLRLANDGVTPIENLVASVELVGFSDAPLDVPVGTLYPTEEKEIELPLVVDAARFTDHRANQPAVLRVVFRYDSGQVAVRQQHTRGIVVYARDAISWSDPSSVAAFVTPGDATVRRLAGFAIDTKPRAMRSDGLAGQVALHALFRSLELSYVPDAATPFGEEVLDSIQFARETIAKGGGDCDDLAVLFATFAEAAGIPALLAVFPDHVIVALDTGVPVQGAHLVTLSPARLLTHAGSVWVPIETTRVSSSFLDAWDAGAEELGRWKDTPERMTLVPLRSAWEDYPPSIIPPSIIPTGITRSDSRKPSRLDSLAAESRSALSERHEKEVADAVAEVEGKIGKTEGTAPLGARLAFLRILQGRAAAAVELLETSAQDPSAGPTVFNALGNAYLITGRVDAALSAYWRAIKGASPKALIPVRLNMALAALVSGDYEALAEHVAECVELGGALAVARLSRIPSVGLGGMTGAGTTGGVRRDLARVAREVLRQRGLLPPDDATGKSRDSQAGASLESLLFWL